MVQTPGDTTNVAARLLKKYAPRLPRLTPDRRRRIVSAVASDLEGAAQKRSKKAA